MPVPFPTLVPCSSCGCHARPGETECPHCGATMRAADGAVPRTKVAVLMGLTAALLQPLACAAEVTDQRDQASSSSSGWGGDINVGAAYGGGPSSTSGTGGWGGDINVGAAYGGGPSTTATVTGGWGGDINVGAAYGGGPSVSTTGTGGAGGDDNAGGAGGEDPSVGGSGGAGGAGGGPAVGGGSAGE
ncbi:hypothetical protein [Sorangium cellulosum]|nr:hypothetical protein [Sorangium cellulosum]